MKRLFRIFELLKNEQRVILIVMLVLLTIAFIGYQRRIYRFRLQVISTTESKPSPSPVQMEHER
jgi:hypothetical protein